MEETRVTDRSSFAVAFAVPGVIPLYHRNGADSRFFRIWNCGTVSGIDTIFIVAGFTALISSVLISTFVSDLVESHITTELTHLISPSTAVLQCLINSIICALL